MQFYEARLLTNATVVNDAIKFVSDYSNNNKKLSLRKRCLKFAGAFHLVNTSSIRFWVFLFSRGEPLRMFEPADRYFIGMFLYCQCVSFCHLFLYCLIMVIFSSISCCHDRSLLQVRLVVFPSLGHQGSLPGVTPLEHPFH
jgi:hypothetical protein